MSLPGNVTTITVTGTFVDFTGTALSGSVTFTPPAELVDAADTTILSSGPIFCQLDTSGHFSVVLPCTDDSNLSPDNWVYVVTENVRGQRTYPIALPHTLGSTVDLSTLAPTTGE